MLPHGSVGPDVNFLHGAELAGANLISGLAQWAMGRMLIAHLRGDALIFGNLTQAAGFPNRMRERLLAIYVFAHLHGLGGHHGVVVIRHADGDSVDTIAEVISS